MMGSWSLGDYFKKKDVNGATTYLQRFLKFHVIDLRQLAFVEMKMLQEILRLLL